PKGPATPCRARYGIGLACELSDVHPFARDAGGANWCAGAFILRLRRKRRQPQIHEHWNMLLRIEPCTPQLASTTWVTPKSAATDMSAIASSSLSLWAVMRKRRSLR